MTQLVKVGKINGIDIKTLLKPSERVVEISLEDLTRETRDAFKEYKNERESKRNILDKWTNPPLDYFQIGRDGYFHILKIKDSIVYDRSVKDNRLFMTYLLQSKNIKELKFLCREEFEGLKGYSGLNKKQLIEFITESLSEEEIKDFIVENEMDIISLNFAKALSIIKGKGKEKLKTISIVNPKEHEIELSFEGFEWTTTSYLVINSKTIHDPERSCDCVYGMDNGFCPHFWIGFIIAYKRGFFKSHEWKLTLLPHSFDKIVKGIKIEAKA